MANISASSFCLSFSSSLSDSLPSISISISSPGSSRFPLIISKESTRRETVKIRHTRIRKKLNGTSERPRLAVFRSNQHMYAQVIDDTKGFTLASASTIQKSLREELDLSSGPTIDAAKKIGEEIAKACLAKGIKKVAFDRGGFVYHGRVKALAESARENGLEF